MILRAFALAAMLAVFTHTASASEKLEVPEAVQPGALIVGLVIPGSSVTVDGEPVRVSPDGIFLTGVGRDDTGSVMIRSDGPGGVEEQTVAILPREYDIQRIDGLPKKTVTPDPETAERIGRESSMIREVRKLETDDILFRDVLPNAFAWPVTGRISGVYGSQRVLNGNPRRPHFGVDIAAPEGTPIQTMAPGIVRLVHEDMVLTGKTVMVDHGHGLMSVYIHMSEIKVAEGQQLNSGDIIGAVGQTGRATGPHLHWGVTLFSEQLDPMLLAGPMPEG